MPHSFSADGESKALALDGADIEAQPQTASGRSGKGRGGNRGPHTAAGVLDMPDPPERTRIGKIMDRVLTGLKKTRKKP